MFLFGELIALPPPDWVIENAYFKLASDAPIMNTWGEDYANRKLYHETGEFLSSNNRVVYLDEPCLEWAKKNISNETIDIRVFSSMVGRVMTGPHTDMTRKYTLLYLLKSGGPHHKSVYYKEKGDSNVSYPGRYSVTDFSQLEQLCQVQIPLNKWILLNSHVLHSVEQIQEGRISIQINMDLIPTDVSLRNCISVSNYHI